MKLVELYGKVRYAVQIEGISRREAARRFGIDPRTVTKMLLLRAERRLLDKQREGRTGRELVHAA
jgi:transposase